MHAAIEVEALTKRFGATVALDAVDAEAEQGTVLSLLGPNGAGKTTLVKVLATLVRPDAGRATVAGHDVVADAVALRSAIGLTGQFAAVDELLTGRENLELVGLWHHLAKQVYRRRAAELLDRFGLTASADRLVKSYSGGMRRRLDVAASLISRPPVLFLDEPTTGLDPRNRTELWRFVDELVAEGTTVLLTTQYMDEAERLAHRIVVIDRGRVIARGTAEELKRQVGGDVLEVRARRAADLPAAADVLAGLTGADARVDTDRLLASAACAGGVPLLIAAGRRFEDLHIELDDLGIRAPTMDDVFLALTAAAEQPGGKVAAPGPQPAGAVR